MKYIIYYIIVLICGAVVIISLFLLFLSPLLPVLPVLPVLLFYVIMAAASFCS